MNESRSTIRLASILALAIAAFAVVEGRVEAARTYDHEPRTVGLKAGSAPSWSDEFRGPAGGRPNRSRWAFDRGGGGWGNDEIQTYTASRRNARLDGRGNLAIVAHRVGGKRRFTSARLKTRGKFSFRYGRVAMRARLPAGRGLWPAFWMLGRDFPELDWPFCGEIDIVEMLGQDPRRIYGYVHGPGSLDEEGVGGSKRVTRSLARGFHVYSADWSAERITFSLDGLPYATVARATYPPGQTWAFDRPMFLLLNMAVGGEWPGPPGRNTRFPARMKVDWVRVWENGA